MLRRMGKDLQRCRVPACDCPLEPSILCTGSHTTTTCAACLSLFA